MEYNFKDKTILVTGGVGSIGSALVKKLIKQDPRSIRILDIDENNLFEFGQKNIKENVRTFVGDIRDKERLNRAMKGVDVVFHAAALKHVPLCEYNPFEAVKTNVIGTQNLIETAIDENIEKFITISTDKAVNPVNVMGATKLLSERLTISANTYKGDSDTKFSCCRFGNVMNSRGSVIPLFVNQIRSNKKITITDKLMTRFMMTLENATKLVLNVGEISSGSEIFILKMHTLRIVDLAEAIITILSEKENISYDKEIEYIGPRPGEKLNEKLITSIENAHCYESDDMYMILPIENGNYIDKVPIPKGFRKTASLLQSSEKTKLLTKEEIIKIVEKMELQVPY